MFKLSWNMDAFNDFRDEINGMVNGNMQEIKKRHIEKLASLYLRNAKALTPVGEKKKNTVTIHGQQITFRNDSEMMRRQWHDKDFKQGDEITSIKIVNNASYASFVNDGHRQGVGRFVPLLGRRLKAPWVEGLHITDYCDDVVKRQSEALFNESWNEVLKGGGNT